MIVNIIRAGGCVVLCLGVGVCMLIVCGLIKYFVTRFRVVCKSGC